MHTLRGFTLFVMLLLAVPAYAQTADPAGQPETMPENGYHQNLVSVIGRITAVDLTRSRITLDDTLHFTLVPAFQFTSAPALGQVVEVIYEEQAGGKMARSVDIGSEGGDSN